MCGINGFISCIPLDGQTAYAKLGAMNNKIIHRGPDEAGFFVEMRPEQTIGFAMRRLSVIDLSTGTQPIFTEDKQKVIVFNGEIFNYKTLKDHLVKEGKLFATNTDTEVILKLYEKYGVESFKLLDGMFAFSILDKTINKLYIARDFFGEKPLYYCQDNKGLYWCSELKSLVNILDKRPTISRTGLNLYLQLTYIPAPFTIYEGIHKLESNHFIEYNLDTQQFSINEIHEVEKAAKIKKNDISFDEAKDKVRDLVEKSIHSRSVSDVPLGTFLSGGVDSSIVTVVLAKSLNQRINTFSVGFDKKSFDETDKSRVVADLISSNHHEFIIGEKDFEKDLDPILLNFDEPFADASALPSYFVAHKTKEFVKVALTGDGGDEMFGGYNKYRIGSMNKRYTAIVPKAIHQKAKVVIERFLNQKEDSRGMRFKIKKTLNAIDYQGDFFYNIIKQGFTNDQLKRIILPHLQIADAFLYYKSIIGPATNLTEFREVDRNISLEGGMLVKVDRTSMQSSLESRAPFLNRAIWNFTNSLPEEYLLNGNDKKRILKKSFENEFPKCFLEKSKQGFIIPVGDWLKTSLKCELLSFTEKSFIEGQNIFQYEAIQNMVNNHINRKQDNTYSVWTYYCFQKWYHHTFLKF